jgi:hypothetical protein
MKTIVLLITLVTVARAGTIIAETGPVGVQYAIFNGEAITSSWSSLNTYDNVNIFLTLSEGLNNSDSPNSGDAYLTTAIGPGSTNTSEVAHTSFTFPSDATEMEIFSGLDLTQGTYYLTLFSDSAQGGGWDATDTPAVVDLDSGTSRNNSLYSNALTGDPNPSYPPASPFSSESSDLVYQLLYQVDGDLITPEPSTFILGGMGALYLYMKLRKVA